jgi:hypothetical protein
MRVILPRERAQCRGNVRTVKVRAIALLAVAIVAVACGPRRGDTARANKLGLIVGFTRDRTSGEYIAQAAIEVGGRSAKSDANGTFQVDDIRPGRHTLTATYAGQPVTIRDIDVSAGMATYVDVTFTLGEPSAIVIDWGDPRQGEIQRFATKVPHIEGTVGDADTRERIPGAVVTAAQGRDDETLQTVTDDHGRYRFDNVSPGTYAISAYYSVSGRAQIEVRRSDIKVAAGEGVLVPLWIEVARH